MIRPFLAFTAVLATTCAVAITMTSSGCSPDAATRPLRVGMELSYPPFEMTDTDGRPTGVSVRLAEALAADLGRDLVIENITFDGLIPALKTGKIDCIISSMTATPERARSIAFSDPYLKTGLALLVAKDSPVNAAADLDQPGRVVAVKKGTREPLAAAVRAAFGAEEPREAWPEAAVARLIRDRYADPAWIYRL